jgi:hypothetical protein
MTYSIVHGVTLVGSQRGKMRLIESNAKFRHLKKFTCVGTLWQVFICLRPPPLLGYCLRWSNNFVGSESGQIQSVKLLQTMVSNRTKQNGFTRLMRVYVGLIMSAAYFVIPANHKWSTIVY